MKKTLCVFLAVLLLLFPVGCGERKVPMPTGIAETEMPTTTESTKETPAPPPEPTLTQAPEPTFVQTPTPAPTPTSTPTQTPSPESVPVGAELTDDDQFTILRNCLLRADAALAPILGDGVMEKGSYADEDGHIWCRLSGYKRAEEMREELRGVFTQDLADNFFSNCYEGDNSIIKEKGGYVYVRADSRDVLGHYYKIKYDTLSIYEHPEWFYYGEDDWVLMADGEGECAPFTWWFGFVKNEDGSYQIAQYYCFVDEWKAELSILAGEIPYNLSSLGSPTWLGEPIKVVHETASDGLDYHVRTEFYDGFNVTLSDRDNPDYVPWYIFVTKPGVSTEEGIEVGDTKRKVLAVYPQFYIWGYDSSPSYPYYMYTEAMGGTTYFEFDENYILTEISFHYNVSN